MDENLNNLVSSLMTEPRDESVIQELSSYLQGNPDACREFLEYCRIHTDLQYLLSSEKVERLVLDRLAAAVLAPQPPRKEFFVRKHLGKGLLGMLALAATLAIVALWPVQTDPHREQAGLRMPAIVANVVSADGAVWQDKRFSSGDALQEGTELSLEKGIIKIGTPSGAEVLLEGPCEVSLPSPDHIVLNKGKLTAQVAEWVAGFEVETPSLRIVEAKGQFALLTDGQGNSEAHALEGQVRVQPLVNLVNDSRKSFLVNEGKATRVNRLARSSSMFAAERGRFVTQHGEFRPYRPIEIYNTGRHLSVGDEDPHWEIVAGAVGLGYQGPQYAVVCEPDGRYLPNSVLVSQWLSVARNLRPGCLPNSIYTFRTEVDLSGYDLSTVNLLADILADNGVSAVRINGEPVELVSWQDNVYMQEFHRFRRAEFKSGFVKGTNVIEIDVWNGVYHFETDDKDEMPTPNPMSIRVEWQAFGIPLEESLDGSSTI